MSESKVPINRIGKFFGAEDFKLQQDFGQEWLHGWLNFTLILYRIDRYKTKTDSVYGETVSDGIKFLPPVEFKGYVQILQPENKYLGTSKIDQMEPGNLKVSVYNRDLEELEIDISYGDYIGYYETEDRVRYYTVNNDGRVTSDNKHSYGGFKPFYRTIMASPVTNNEFRGL
jgi:hypothetical protein